MSDGNTVIFPRKLLKRFIILYKELSCLWDRESVAYKIKMKRHDAITKLTELVQEYDPSATRVHILRKVESLRACVRREYKKVQESRRTATSEDEIYTPQLWYYDLFSFIFKYDELEYKKENLVVGLPDHSAESEEEIEEAADGEHPFECGDYSGEYISTGMIEMSDSPPITKRHLPCDDEKNKRFCTEIEDEYDAIGINVAAKLRYLPPTMRILAEKLINDVLFQAQTNGLSSATVISTPDPFKHDIL